MSLFFLALFCLFAFNSAQLATGIANFFPRSGNGVTGTITFVQTAIDRPVEVAVKLSGVNGASFNGILAIHVYTYGDLRGYITGAGANVAKALSTGPHYDPSNSGTHRCPEAPGFDQYHAGDLGNWAVVNGVINQNKTIQFEQGLTLFGVNSIIGRSVVVRNATDDCLTVDGNSGARLAAGVIGIANDPNGNAANYQGTATEAVCVVQGTSNKPDVSVGDAGLFYFQEIPGPLISVKARLLTGDNLEHAFHVHKFGDLSATDGTSAGPHLDIDNNGAHGLPTVNPSRHLGDFGSIKTYDAATKNGYYNFAPNDYTPQSSLKMVNFIGRTVIVHADLDHGNEPTCDGGNTTGAAGARWFQCIIGIMNPIDVKQAGNNLEVVTPPASLRFDNTWKNVPCNTAAPTVSGVPSAPTTPTGPTGPTAQPVEPYRGLSGGAVVGIIIACLIVVGLIAAVVVYLFVTKVKGDNGGENYQKFG